MKKIYSENLVVVGAAYMPATVGKLINAIAEAGFLPYNVGLHAVASIKSKKDENYWSIMQSALACASCYILLIPQDSDTFGIAQNPVFRDEISLVKSVGTPVIILYQGVDGKRCADEIRNALGDLVRDCRICTHENLLSKAKAALKKVAAQMPTADGSHGKDKSPEKQASAPTAFSPPNQPAGACVSFQGFYYSQFRFETRHFWVDIGTTPTTYKGKTAYFAWEQGYHDNHAGYYHGYAYIQSGYLHLDLDRVPNKDDSLNIRVGVGTMEIENFLKNPQIHFGSIQGLASIGDGRAFCYKAALVRIEGSRVSVKPDIKLQIERFLNLSRKSFVSSLTKQQEEGVESLHIPPKTLVNGAKHIEGTYRIWTMGHSKKGDITQSVMTIESNYKGRVRNPIFDNVDQICEISFCEGIGRPKVIFVMRKKEPPENGQITSVAIAHLPKEDFDRPIVGAFCSVGQPMDVEDKAHRKDAPSTETRSGYFVAKKVEETSLKPCFIDVKTIEEDKEMEHLLPLLSLLWQENRSKGGKTSDWSSGGIPII